MTNFRGMNYIGSNSNGLFNHYKYRTIFSGLIAGLYIAVIPHCWGVFVGVAIFVVCAAIITVVAMVAFKLNGINLFQIPTIGRS